MPFVQTQSGRHIETDLSLDELDLTAAGSMAACTEDEITHNFCQRFELDCQPLLQAGLT